MKACPICGNPSTTGNRCRSCAMRTLRSSLTKKDKICPICGRPSISDKRCLSCAQKARRVLERTNTPPKICSICGEPTWQDPCHSCSAKIQWEDETRKEKQSQIFKTLWADPEYKARVLAKVHKAISAPEIRKKLSENAKVQWHNGVWAYKLNTDSPGTCRICGAQLKCIGSSICHSCETKEQWKPGGSLNNNMVRLKRSNASKAAWERGAYDNTTFLSPSSLEVKFATALTDLGISFSQQFPVSTKRYDFHILNTNILIEIDGDYWHSLPTAIVNDKFKDTLAEKAGFRLIRITETELREQGYLEIIRTKLPSP